MSPRQGQLTDWITQRWVQTTGQRVEVTAHLWLENPVGDVDVIGMDFFQRWAQRNNLEVIQGLAGQGLMDDFSVLTGTTFNAEKVHPDIPWFYENTSDFAFDVWSEWSSIFRPFGWLLAAIFSRRLQQLNVPLRSLDTSLGVRSEVLKIRHKGGDPLFSAWVRESSATRLTIYAGCYSTCQMPGFDGVCVKVAFPLPNGFALVVMRPESAPDGSFTLRSEGKRFGDPGFYFFVEDAPGRGWARYVASLHEHIRVYVDSASVLRADHVLKLWGMTFLKLHYRMSSKSKEIP